MGKKLVDHRYYSSFLLNMKISFQHKTGILQRRNTLQILEPICPLLFKVTIQTEQNNILAIISNIH